MITRDFLKNAMKIAVVAIAAMMVTGMVSCKKATRLSADVLSIKMDVDGGQGSTTLDTDGKELKVEHAPAWMNVNISGTLLTYNAGHNDTRAVRSDSVVVSCDGTLRLNIPVQQATVATYLNLRPDKITIGKEGGRQSVKVDTDGSHVNVSSDDNVTVSYENGSVVVVAPENTGYTRTAKVNVQCDELSETLTVTIKGSICSRCKGKGYITCTQCHGEGGYYDYWGDWVTCYYCDNYCHITCPSCKGTGR